VSPAAAGPAASSIVLHVVLAQPGDLFGSTVHVVATALAGVASARTMATVPSAHPFPMRLPG
jgi:hypothetical protein